MNTTSEFEAHLLGSKFYFETVSKRVGDNQIDQDWVVYEAAAYAKGERKPLFVGEREAAQHEAARLNRLEADRYRQEGADLARKGKVIETPDQPL